MRTRLLFCVVVLGAATILRADELRTLGGKGVSGATTLVNDKEIVLTTAAGPVSTPLSQALALDLRPIKGAAAGVKYTDVRLLDDTLLHCSAVNFKGKTVELTLTSGIKLELGLEFLVWMAREGQDQALVRKWDKIAAEKVRSDRIIVLQDGELNALEGTLGEVDVEKQTIAFKFENETRQIGLPRLHGMIFFRLQAPQVATICKVVDVDGNALAASSINYDGTTVNVSTPFGAKLSLAGTSVARLDFNLGKLTFLSDLEPSKVTEKSGIGLVVRYRKDANLDGEPLLLDRSYAKGLSLHAHTELEYNLAGKFKEFKALLGVDTRIGTDSQAVVSIYCDNEKRFSEKVSAKALRPIALKVNDVNTLRIVVSSANIFDLHDHATLADAQVRQ